MHCQNAYKRDNDSVGEDRETGTLLNCWWKCTKMVQSLWKIVWQFLKMLNRKLPQLTNSTPRHIPKRTENLCPHKTCLQMLSAALFIMAPNGNPNVHQLMNGLTKCDIFNITEFYSAIKRTGIFVHATARMNLEIIMWKNSHRKPLIIGFHSYKIPRTGKFFETKYFSDFQGLGGNGRWLWIGTELHFGAMKCSKINCSDNCISFKKLNSIL